MKSEFPINTAWSLSRLDDIRTWLPSLSHLQPTRELTLLIFDIRQAGELLINFDASRVLDKEGTLSDNENPLPLSSHPSPPLVSSSSPLSRPKRVPRRQTLAKEPLEDIDFIDESATQPSSTIRVKRTLRANQVAETSDVVEKPAFLPKVFAASLSFSSFY